MTPLRAILLTAVSSPAQATSDKESLEAQERDLRELAAREGWQVVDVLRIAGHSRRYYNYHEFADDMRAHGFDAADKMFEHWRAKDFDVLAVWMGDRLSREQSMFAEIISRTIDGDAAIYDLHSGGWIRKDNYRMYAAMSGYAAASAVDSLVTRGRATKDANVRKGLVPGGFLPFAYRFVRDEQGKKIRVEVNEEYRAMAYALAQALLDGVAWGKMPQVLKGRGYARPDGKAYSFQTFYRLFYNPITWGHVARGYSHSERHRNGRWAYDKSEPPPANVLITYDAHEPLFDGVLGERVRAELDRRREIRGRMNPAQPTRFSGLFMCAECGSSLILYRGNGNWRGLRCARVRYGECTNRHALPEREAQRYLDAMLKQMIRAKKPALPHFQREDTHTQRDALERAITKSHERIHYLIDREVDAHEDERPFYREKIKQERIKIRTNQRSLDALERAHAAEERRNKSLAMTIDQLREMSLVDFWRQDALVINQTLRRILGGMKFAVRGREVVDVRPYTRPLRDR